MKRDDEFLTQLVESLENAIDKLEDSYYKKDIDRFNQIKKMMLQINDKISMQIK